MLDAKTSVAVGLASAGMVAVIYSQVVPKVTDIRVANAGDRDVAAAEKLARWTSAGFVVGIAAITWDSTVFIIGGLALITFSWAHRHANLVNPGMGAATMPSSRSIVHGDDGYSAGYTPAG